MDERNFYGGFDIAGGRMYAYMPNGPDEPQVWTVEFVRDGEIRHSATIDMLHPPIFGPDVDDVRNLNEAIEALIAEAGLE